MMQQSESDKNLFGLISWAIMSVKLLLHLLTSTRYEMHRDELLYFNMADHPDFGYVSVPPLTGWLALVDKSIFGYSAFGLRLLPAIMGVSCVWLLSRMVSLFGGGWRALLLAGTMFLLSPGYLLFHGIFTPNATEQFLWLLIIYQVMLMVRDDEPGKWVLIGALAGLAILNKYSVVILLAGLFGGLLFSSHRKLLASRHLVIGIMAACIIASPNFIWQFRHAWPVFHHMAELQKTQLAIRGYGDFFYEIFSLLGIGIIVAIAGLVLLLFMRDVKKYRYLGISAVAILLLLLLSRGKGYYSLGLMPMLIAYGAIAMEKYLPGRKTVFYWGLMVLNLLYSLAALPYGLPMMPLFKLHAYTKITRGRIPYPFSSWEDGNVHAVSQVYADMTGWEELTKLVARAYMELTPEEKKRCTIYCEKNYGDAGAIHFYGKKYGLPQPITFLETYTLWAPDTIPKGPVIFINKDIDGLENIFGSIIEIGSVNDPYFRENGLKVFLCRLPGTQMQQTYRETAAREKKVFR